MEEYPKISIVTPSFNDAQYLEKTILSVINQGYPNLEYIIIDGGSTDGSIDVIKKYERQITYWISEPDKGMYFAIQKGFERSTGEIMGWINSDDMLHNGSLFTVGQIFGDFNQINWIQGFPNVIDENGRIVLAFSWPELSKLYFYKKSRDTRKYFQQESSFWRRSLWIKAGGYVSDQYKLAGDFELWIRFFQYDRLFNVTALLGSFRVSNSGQASIENFDRYIAETNQILEKFPLSPNEKKKLMTMQIVERIERIVLRSIEKLKSLFRIIDRSAVHNHIYFDNIAQRFKIRN